MRKFFAFAALGALLLSGAAALTGCHNDHETPQVVAAAPAAPEQSPLEHGKYLVERVGLCADCHSPHGKQGPDPEKFLQGSMLGFDPKGPVPGWVAFAPKIAGLPNGWTKEDMAHFMETGEKPGGVMAGPPMPPYRLNAEDAKAVAEYLATLK